MHTTLLIMAAGMGSRYGGNKQIDGMGPNGEMLLEYSIHDAWAAGFDKVVFVIKRSMADDFRALIESRGIPAKVEVHYAFQEFDNLPGSFTVPEGRVKPYGTVHAVLAARDMIDEPFAVINADDFYGRDAFVEMAASLRRMQGREGVASMVAYRLRNTVSENGHVTRGICSVSESGHLCSVTETYKILPFPDGTIRDVETDPEGRLLDPEAPVSMNFWGFTPGFFNELETELTSFLAANADSLRAEYPLPGLVDQLMQQQRIRVRMLTSNAVWFGVTYQEDKAYVAGELQKLHDGGLYPEKL